MIGWFDQLEQQIKAQRTYTDQQVAVLEQAIDRMREEIREFKTMIRATRARVDGRTAKK